MIKIGLKIQPKFTMLTLDKNSNYEIATQRQQDKKFVIFDIFNEPKYLTEDEILKDFIIVEEIKSSINKLKNPNSKHYELWHDLEAIDVIKTLLNKDEYIGFLKGNILKYQLRLSKKDSVEKEVQKIKDYTSELNYILEHTRNKI